jgi:MATE family multidrug resistance protein
MLAFDSKTLLSRPIYKGAGIRIVLQPMFKEFRNTLPIAFPIILSYITQVSFGLIDSAMVGAIDYFQLAASSLVVNVIAIPQVVGTGITMAVSPLVAFASGQKDTKKVSELLYNGFWLSALSGLIIAICIVAGKNVLLHLQQDERVATMSLSYFVVMGWSLFPMMIFLALKQFADGLEYTKTGMVISLVALPVNAFLCWLLIFGKLGMPRLELLGAGFATLITRILQALVMGLIIYRHRIFQPFIQVRNTAWHINKKTIKELLHIGIPSSMQYTMEAGAFSVSGIMIGWLGASAQAAHQIALNCASFTFMASLGLSLAGSIRVSNAFGQRNRELLRNIGTSTIAGGITYGFACALLFVILRNQLPLLFNTDAEVIRMASTLLLFGALFQISDATQAIGVGLLRGIKDVKRPTFYVAVAYWIIGIPVGYWLAFKLQMGAAGIWIGFVAGLTASSLLLNHRFLRKTILNI